MNKDYHPTNKKNPTSVGLDIVEMVIISALPSSLFVDIAQTL